MSLAEHVFSATPQGYTLGISGVEFGRIEEEMSGEAKKNLGLAETFLLDWLKNQPD